MKYFYLTIRNQRIAFLLYSGSLRDLYCGRTRGEGKVITLPFLLALTPLPMSLQVYRLFVKF